MLPGIVAGAGSSMATTRKFRRTASIGGVLVVEDDGMLALDLVETLQEHGAAETQICATSAEALAALRERRFDHVILDVHLADTDDGWAIAELIDTVGPAGPKVIFSTGSPEDIPADIAELGQVLGKPYSADQLLEAMQNPRKGLLGLLRRRSR